MARKTEIKQTDLLKLDNTVWISEAVLTSMVGVSNEYLRLARFNFRSHINDFSYGGVQPNVGKSWRYARLKGNYYYDIESLPERADTNYKAKVSELLQGTTPVDLKASERLFKEALKKEAMAQLNYADGRYYMYTSEIFFEEEKAMKMSETLAYFRAIVKFRDENLYKKYACKTKSEFWKLAINTLKDIELEGIKLTTPESLRVTLVNFPESELSQREFLISGKYQNTNRLVEHIEKIETVDEITGEIATKQVDIHNTLLYQLWANPELSNKLNKDQVYESYKQMLVLYGAVSLSYRSVCHRLDRFATRSMLSSIRDGQKYFDTKFAPYVPSYKPQFALSYIVADGSGTKLAYKKKVAGKWKKETLYAVHFYDVATGAMLGYAHGKNETPEMAQNALKMAVKNANFFEFGTILTDNHGAFTGAESKNLFKMVARKVRTITPGNSQANDAESLIKLFHNESRVCANWLYTGFNSQFNINEVQNSDFYNVEELPDYDMAVQQLAALVNKWNGTPRQGQTKTPMELVKEMTNPKLETLPDVAIRRVAGFETSVDLDYMRGFVYTYKDINIFGKEVPVQADKYYKQTGTSIRFAFEVPDWHTNQKFINEQLGNTSDMKVRVVWDETMADLYTPAGKFLLSCKLIEKSRKAEIEQEETDLQTLGHHLKRKEQYHEAARNTALEIVQNYHLISGKMPNTTVENIKELIEKWGDKQTEQLSDMQTDLLESEINDILANSSFEQSELLFETEVVEQTHDLSTYEMLQKEKKGKGVKEAYNAQFETDNSETNDEEFENNAISRFLNFTKHY